MVDQKKFMQCSGQTYMHASLIERAKRAHSLVMTFEIFQTAVLEIAIL